MALISKLIYKFIYATLNLFGKLTQSENPQALTLSRVYVDATATVYGTRDGSWDYPYATIQDAIDHYGVPTTQAEYLQVKEIIVLDSSIYTENLTFPMGIWIVRFGSAELLGTITWEIDSAERFGSSEAPVLFLDRNTSNIDNSIAGNITVTLKSGGTAVSVLRVIIAGMIATGDITIADGTNAGASCASIPIFAMYRASLIGEFKNRLSICSFIQSNLTTTTASHEFGYINSVQNASILATNIMEARSSTTTKTIRDLTLNTAGGVTWNSTGSARNWNVDVPSANEVLNKITSFPSNPINLLRVESHAMDFSNGLDMENGDIENVTQIFGNAGTTANPTLITGDIGLYGDTTKTLYLVEGGVVRAQMSVGGYNILSNSAGFGDLTGVESGLAVFFDQINNKVYIGDRLGTVSETYTEIDNDIQFIRQYVNGVQVLDIQANSVEILRSVKLPSTVVNTATYNIVGNEPYISVTRTATGTCTLTLPVITAAMDGNIIPIADDGYNASVNDLRVLRGGTNTIEDGATEYLFTNDAQVTSFKANFTTGNWKAV